MEPDDSRPALSGDVVERIEDLHRAASEAQAALVRTVAANPEDGDTALAAAGRLMQARRDFLAYVRSLAE